MPDIGSDQHSIVVLRVKRPRTASPLDDIVVNGHCKRRAVSGVNGVSESISSFSIGNNGKPNVVSQIFERIDTLSSESMQASHIEIKLRDHLKAVQGHAKTVIPRRRGDCATSVLCKKIERIDQSRFLFVDVDPLCEDASLTSKYELLMKLYQLDSHEANCPADDDYVWDLFVYNGNNPTNKQSDRVCIEVAPEIDLYSELHDPVLLFGEYSDSEYDSEDSNCAENPDFSYPEDESDSEDDESDSDEYDPYDNDDDLDAVADYDQS